MNNINSSQKNSQSIDFSQFKEIMKQNENDQGIMKAELIEAFKIFDTENKGFISAKELKQRLEQMGE